MLSITEYLERGPSTSKEIQAATGQSQSTVSRMLKKMGGSIVQIQDGRLIKYASTCNAFSCDDRIPVSIVDKSGRKELIAHVRPLNCGQFFLEPVSSDFSSLLLGEEGSGLYNDLPYFLLDLKPQGYLGRQIAKKMAKQSDGFPSNPKVWGTNHIGRYLVSNGEDLPGNIIFGDQMLLRIQRNPITVSQKDYPKLADSAVKGDPPGSPAGGEQPKFTAFNRDLHSHVIVKFTARGKNEIATRWRDVLITEYHAAEVLSSHGYPAAESRLFEEGGRMFLETQRFDRVGELGRKSMISLDIIDREFVGLGNNWSRVMHDLFSQGIVTDDDVLKTRELQYFGLLINNTDMHLGNLSLSMEGAHFRLLPAYDMCSMGFAPTSGEILPFDFELDLQDTNINIHSKGFVQEIAYEAVQEMAHESWERVLDDDRISNEFRDYLSQGNPVDLDSFASGIRM